MSTRTAPPSRQSDDACRIAGPDNPRCVNSIASAKLCRPAAAATGSATPLSGRISASMSPPNVSGTSPGRSAVTGNPKRRARSCANPVASHFRDAQPASGQHK